MWSSVRVTAALPRFSKLLILTVTLTGCALSSNPASNPAAEQTPIAQTSPAASSQPTDASAITPSAAPADQGIWSRLQTGTGYVVLLRHAQTEPGSGDPPGFRLEDCATQRNLSADGRAQATRIGEVFRSQEIRVVQVLSSQYCRCLETAKLMNVGTVEPAPMLNSTFEDQSSEAQQVQQMREKTLSHQGLPDVIVMVTHYANIAAISGIAPQSGDAVVLQANEGAIEVVGQLRGI